MSWAPVTTPSGISGGEALAFVASDGAGRWVIGSNGVHTWVSTDDGNTWSGPNTVAADLAGMNGLQYLNGTYFAWGPSTSTGNNLYSSSDGATWTERVAGANFNASVISPGFGLGMAYGGGVYVWVGTTTSGSTGSSMTSPDGVTWTLKDTYNPGAGNGFVSVCFDGTHFAAITNDTALTPNQQVGYSTDGATWTFQALNSVPGPDGGLQGIYFYDSKYVISYGFDNSANGGQGQGWLEVATDLTAWNGVQTDVNTTPVGGVPGSLLANEGTTIALGTLINANTSDYFILTTTDGSTYNTEDAGYTGGGSIQTVARGSDGFMAVGSNAVSAPLVTFRPDGTSVPDLAGDTQTAASAALTAVGLTTGTVSNAYNSAVAAGLVFFQNPAAGTTVTPGSAVDFTLSLGPQFATVPDVIGLTAAAAGGALLAAGFVTGTISGVSAPSIAVGDVATQDPVGGTEAPFGSAVDLGISFVVPEFDVDATVISQYANSPTILQLVEDFGEWFDPTANMQQFYLMVWNLQTARGFGLDIWGIILNVSRVVPIPGTSGAFGFDNSDTPPDWENFGNLTNPAAGGPFFSGQISGGSYRLDDGPYLTLLLTKALANICATTAPALNALVSNLFPGRGRCYTIDRGGMQMSYFFEFALTSIELAILEFSGVLAHPAGVGVNINVVPGGFFGFQEAGELTEPWGFGVFYNGN